MSVPSPASLLSRRSQNVKTRALSRFRVDNTKATILPVTLETPSLNVKQTSLEVECLPYKSEENPDLDSMTV